MVMNEDEREIVRRAFARQVMAAVGIEDIRVEAAFAVVRREHFLGPGPWPIMRWRGPSPDYVTTPSDDLVYLYTNDVIGMPTRASSQQRPAVPACRADRRRCASTG